MTLYIDTTEKNRVYLALKKDNKVIKKIERKTAKAQAEKILPLIDELLEKTNFKLSKVKEIEVKNEGGTFTSLRVGVIIANSLAYTLGVKVRGTFGKPVKHDFLDIVKPYYNREPIIG